MCRSESYAGGQSEIVMGQAIKKFGWKRNDIVVSTKVCILRFDAQFLRFSIVVVMSADIE